MCNGKDWEVYNLQSIFSASHLFLIYIFLFRSSYFHFCGEKRSDIKEDHPDATVGEVAKLLSAIWKELSETEKAKYEEMAKKDKERYVKAMEEYNGGSSKKKVRVEE